MAQTVITAGSLPALMKRVAQLQRLGYVLQTVYQTYSWFYVYYNAVLTPPVPPPAKKSLRFTLGPVAEKPRRRLNFTIGPVSTKE